MVFADGDVLARLVINGEPQETYSLGAVTLISGPSMTVRSNQTLYTYVEDGVEHTYIGSNSSDLRLYGSTTGIGPAQWVTVTWGTQQDASAYFSGTVLTDTNGNWSLVIPKTSLPTPGTTDSVLQAEVADNDGYIARTVKYWEGPTGFQPTNNLTVTLFNDTGASASDLVSSDGRIEVSGLMTDRMVKFYHETDEGNVTIYEGWTGDGTVSFVLPEGNYIGGNEWVTVSTLKAEIQDDRQITGAMSVGLIIIDSTPPDQGTFTLEDGSGTSVANGESLSGTTSVLSGAVNSNEIVTIYRTVDGTTETLATVTVADGETAWTYTVSDMPADGTLVEFRIGVSDLAGNVGQLSDAVSVTSIGAQAAPRVATGVVVFDLTSGQSSIGDSGRYFDSNQTYDIYIVVPDDGSAIKTAGLTPWVGAGQLGYDDRVYLVTQTGAIKSTSGITNGNGSWFANTFVPSNGTTSFPTWAYVTGFVPGTGVYTLDVRNGQFRMGDVTATLWQGSRQFSNWVNFWGSTAIKQVTVSMVNTPNGMAPNRSAITVYPAFDVVLGGAATLPNVSFS